MKRHPITRFFRSIAGKVTVMLAVCILLLVSLNWLLNSFALLGNYEREQSNLLIEIYEELDSTPRSQRTLAGLLEGYRVNHQVEALLWSDSAQILYSSEDWESPYPPGGIRLTPLSVPNGTYQLRNRAASPSEPENNWLVLSARTSDGLNLVLQVSLSQVQSGTGIANRFLLWSGLITLLLGTVAAVWLARSLTRPVKRLSVMAEHMAQLDFSDRYTGRGQDEVARLGHSLNAVSETLERNLSELKTANLHLQHDMEKQTRQNEAHSQFIRNVSHELKTPLALIQSYAEGLRENAAAGDESRDYYCTVIEDEAQKLTQMLAKLTTLMQLEAGGEELLIDRFDITALLTRLLQRYAPVFEDRHLSLPALPKTPCLVWGDALLIENVVTNYLTNALHHVSPNGEIHIDLVPTDRDTVSVQIYNTGLPIPEDDMPHIWDSFYKVDKARTRAYGGTGIGLSVVAAIMKAHNMPFGVFNTADGVCFYFELSAH